MPTKRLWAKRDMPAVAWPICHSYSTSNKYPSHSQFEIVSLAGRLSESFVWSWCWEMFLCRVVCTRNQFIVVSLFFWGGGVCRPRIDACFENRCKVYSIAARPEPEPSLCVGVHTSDMAGSCLLILYFARNVYPEMFKVVADRRF